ncbi:uncharacterized protein VTP21DRAFT_5485 [Calcarisporiella thermophila]|uniref:uncharacterized protein n=1 Tax=Calcarisporiella thermophila TaxID=911321 RepID=UPI0037443288
MSFFADGPPPLAHGAGLGSQDLKPVWKSQHTISGVGWPRFDLESWIAEPNSPIDGQGKLKHLWLGRWRGVAACSRYLAFQVAPSIPWRAIFLKRSRRSRGEAALTHRVQCARASAAWMTTAFDASIRRWRGCLGDSRTRSARSPDPRAVGGKQRAKKFCAIETLNFFHSKCTSDISRFNFRSKERLLIVVGWTKRGEKVWLSFYF